MFLAPNDAAETTILLRITSLTHRDRGNESMETTGKRVPPHNGNVRAVLVADGHIMSIRADLKGARELTIGIGMANMSDRFQGILRRSCAQLNETVMPANGFGAAQADIQVAVVCGTNLSQVGTLLRNWVFSEDVLEFCNEFQGRAGKILGDGFTGVTPNDGRTGLLIARIARNLGFAVVVQAECQDGVGVFVGHVHHRVVRCIPSECCMSGAATLPGTLFLRALNQEAWILVADAIDPDRIRAQVRHDEGRLRQGVHVNRMWLGTFVKGNCLGRLALILQWESKCLDC